jgi:hypothetical protein
MVDRDGRGHGVRPLWFAPMAFYQDIEAVAMFIPADLDSRPRLAYLHINPRRLLWNE